MKRICYIMAMRSEAQPFIEHFSMKEQKDYFTPMPCQLYKANGSIFSDIELYLALPGVQHNRDLIGCEAAAMLTTLVTERLQPDLIVNSGTCGAWHRHGMKVGEVLLGSVAMFHDRRVPGDNEWDTQGLGNYTAWERTPAIAQALGLRTAKVTTGSSFNLSEDEEQTIEENEGRLKEMEAAAVAFVCSLRNVPLLIVKGVTNLRDAEDDDLVSFHQNMKLTALNLLKANVKLLEFLDEKVRFEKQNRGSLKEQDKIG